jgi:hypothetical protein
MKMTLVVAVLMMGVTGSALAAGTCADVAAQKKLAGAAKTSFMKKCVVDTCNTSAADKKLYGAAKSSFLKKCSAS